jgi:hypothetical protein
MIGDDAAAAAANAQSMPNVSRGLTAAQLSERGAGIGGAVVWKLFVRRA